MQVGSDRRVAADLRDGLAAVEQFAAAVMSDDVEIESRADDIVEVDLCREEAFGRLKRARQNLAKR